MYFRSWTQRRRPWIRRSTGALAVCAALAFLPPAAQAQMGGGMCHGGGGGGMGGGGMGAGMGGAGSAMQYMSMALQARQIQQAYALEQQRMFLAGQQMRPRGMCHQQNSPSEVRETPKTPQSRTALREKYQQERAARREAYLAKRQQKQPAAPTVASRR